MQMVRETHHTGRVPLTQQSSPSAPGTPGGSLRPLEGLPGVKAVFL